MSRDSRISRLVCNCPNVCSNYMTRAGTISALASPWCAHCVWHTAYYWPWAYNKLLGKLSALLSARDVRSRVWSEEPHCGAGIGNTIIDFHAVLCAFDYRGDATRRERADCNRVRDNFPLIFCMLIFLFCYPVLRGDWFILHAWRFTLGLFELRLHMYISVFALHACRALWLIYVCVQLITKLTWLNFKNKWN